MSDGEPFNSSPRISASDTKSFYDDLWTRVAENGSLNAKPPTEGEYAANVEEIIERKADLSEWASQQLYTNLSTTEAVERWASPIQESDYSFFSSNIPPASSPAVEKPPTSGESDLAGIQAEDTSTNLDPTISASSSASESHHHDELDLPNIEPHPSSFPTSPAAVEEPDTPRAAAQSGAHLLSAAGTQPPGVPASVHFQTPIEVLDAQIERLCLPQGLEPYFSQCESSSQLHFLKTVFCSENPNSLDDWMVRGADGSYDRLEASQFYASIWAASNILRLDHCIDKEIGPGPIWKTRDIERLLDFCRGDKASSIICSILQKEANIDVDIHSCIDRETMTEIVEELISYRSTNYIGPAFRLVAFDPERNMRVEVIDLTPSGGRPELPFVPGAETLVKIMVLIAKNAAPNVMREVLEQHREGFRSLACQISSWAWSSANLHAVAAFRSGMAATFSILGSTEGWDRLVALVKCLYRMRIEIALQVMQMCDSEAGWSNAGLCRLQINLEDNLDAILEGPPVPSEATYVDLSQVLNQMRNVPGMPPFNDQVFDESMEVDESNEAANHHHPIPPNATSGWQSAQQQSSSQQQPSLPQPSHPTREEIQHPQHVHSQHQESAQYAPSIGHGPPSTSQHPSQAQQRTQAYHQESARYAPSIGHGPTSTPQQRTQAHHQETTQYASIGQGQIPPSQHLPHVHQTYTQPWPPGQDISSVQSQAHTHPGYQRTFQTQQPPVPHQELVALPADWDHGQDFHHHRPAGYVNPGHYQSLSNRQSALPYPGDHHMDNEAVEGAGYEDHVNIFPASGSGTQMGRSLNRSETNAHTRSAHRNNRGRFS